MKLVNIGFCDNEQVVCICENDACGVDAIQVMLGCSIGKGNLLFHMTGKQAFSFYNRATGESVRLILKPKPLNMTPEESGEPTLRLVRTKTAMEGFERGIFNSVSEELYNSMAYTLDRIAYRLDPPAKEEE